jgi:hypothetical protein
MSLLRSTGCHPGDLIVYFVKCNIILVQVSRITSLRGFWCREEWMNRSASIQIGKVEMEELIVVVEDNFRV